MKNNTSNHPRYSIVAFASNGKVYGYAELICDEVADLDYLPTENTKIAVGSKCTCLANGKVYTLSNARQWVEDLSNQSDGTDEVYDPLEVSENGDVVVTYNGMKIAATEESGHITLETSGKRVEHDIELEYTKSGSADPAGNIVNITNNSSGTPVIGGSGLITADGIMGVQDFPTYIPSGNSKMFLFNVYAENSETETGMEYTIAIAIEAESDAYNVVLNNTPITYSRGSYSFIDASTTGPITGQTYNLVITDKE